MTPDTFLKIGYYWHTPCADLTVFPFQGRLVPSTILLDATERRWTCETCGQIFLTVGGMTKEKAPSSMALEMCSLVADVENRPGSLQEIDSLKRMVEERLGGFINDLAVHIARMKATARNKTESWRITQEYRPFITRAQSLFEAFLHHLEYEREEEEERLAAIAEAGEAQ